MATMVEGEKVFLYGRNGLSRTWDEGQRRRAVTEIGRARADGVTRDGSGNSGSALTDTPEFVSLDRPAPSVDESTLPGRSLRPITVEIIREELERKRAFPGELVEMYFPSVVARGCVDDRDILDMSRTQADAVTDSLAKGFRSFSKDSKRLQANGEGLTIDNGILCVNHYEINARQYAVALRDLCDKFQLRVDF